MSGPRQRVENFIDGAGNPVTFLADTPQTITSNWTFSGDLTFNGTSNIVGDAFYSMPQITVASPTITTADSGLVAQRYQTDNDVGSGDVITDIPDASGTTTITVATQIDLSSAALTESPVGWWVKVGLMVRKITAWNAPIATVAAWSGGLPLTSAFQLFRGNFAAMVFREIDGGWAALKCSVLADDLNGRPIGISAGSVKVTDGTNTTEIVATPGVNQVFTMPALSSAGTFTVEEVYHHISNYVKSATAIVAVTSYDHLLIRTANYVKIFWKTLTPLISTGTTVSYETSVALPARFRPAAGAYQTVVCGNGLSNVSGYVIVAANGIISIRLFAGSWSGTNDQFGLFSAEWGM